MQRIQLSKNFFLDEYISRELYFANQDPASPFSAYPDKIWHEILRRKIDDRLVESDQALRDLFGPVMINNWAIGGERQWCGYRPYDCPVGSTLSDHREGSVSDKIFQDYSAEEVIHWLKVNDNYKKVGITIIEEFRGKDITWLHSGVSWTNSDNLKIIWM